MEWISTKDRLPALERDSKYSADVLVATKNCGPIEIAHIDHTESAPWWRRSCYCQELIGRADEVTHWAPLPAKPKF